MRRYEPKPWDIRRCDMIHADEGEYVLYCEAQAEIERLTKERDEAVAAAYKAAAIRSENYALGAPYNQRASINALANSLRGMTPDDAKAALEAYGREKVLEEALALLTVRAGSLVFAHHHGNGLEGWHKVIEGVDCALTQARAALSSTGEKG